MVTVCSTLGVTTHWSTPHDHTPQPPTHLFLINAQHNIDIYIGKTDNKTDVMSLLIKWYALFIWGTNNYNGYCPF